jgi:hypothetical protein
MDQGAADAALAGRRCGRPGAVLGRPTSSMHSSKTSEGSALRTSGSSLRQGAPTPSAIGRQRSLTYTITCYHVRTELE